MSRKVLSTVLILAMTLIFVLSGCGPTDGTTTNGEDSTSGNTKENVTITIITMGEYTPGGPAHGNTGETSVVVTDVYPEYEKRMPHVTLEFETLQGDTEGYSSYLLRGSSGTLPDISMLDGYWVASFASQDYTVPMDDIVGSQAMDNYLDAFKCFYDGKVHGLVHSTAFNGVLWYRESLLEEAGFDGPPETWEELRECAKALTTEDRYGLAMPLAKSEHTTVCLLGYYWSGEDVFVSSDNLAEFNNDTSLELFELIKGMQDDGSLPPESMTMMYDDAERMFGNGMAAMLQHGSWLCTGWEERAPDYADDIMIAPLPPHPETGESSQNAGGWGYSVTTTDESKYEAIAEWLKIMLVEKEFAKKRIAEAGEIPVTRDLAEEIDWLPEKYSDVMSEILLTSKTRPIVEIYPDASLEYVQALQEYLDGGKTAEQALADAVDRVENLARESGWID